VDLFISDPDPTSFKSGSAHAKSFGSDRIWIHITGAATARGGGNQAYAGPDSDQTFMSHIKVCK
jgi:hypothetical protein